MIRPGTWSVLTLYTVPNSRELGRYKIVIEVQMFS